MDEQKNDSADKKNVLVVDDDDNLRTVLIDKLTASGFSASGAVDGEEGLGKAFALHPDLILLDLIMPKMDGLTTLAKLREDEWGKKVKVIVLTVLENPEYLATAMQKGIFGYFIKTNYSLDNMIKQVEDALRSPGKSAS